MIAAAKSPVGTLNSPVYAQRFPRGVLLLNLGFGLRSGGGGLYRLSLDRSKEMELVRRLRKGCLAGKRKGQKEKVKVKVKVEVESFNGGVNVFDAAPEHLVIMVNGIIGSAADWRYAAEQFVKRLPDKVIVHRSECNSSRLTFDGVDRMGERLAEEVLDVIRRWPDVRKISFVAHSLGGLVARYAIGRLYDKFPVSSGLTGNYSSGEHINNLAQCQQHYEDRVAGLEPINFITFATPHLGSRGHRQLPFLCGLPFLERSASQTAHWLVGRSGKHLFLTDNDNGRPPLLVKMVYDSDDLKFMSALRAFKRRAAYANASYDHVVGWRTSSIRRQHELPKANLLVKDKKYPHIVHVERETAEDIQNKASSIVRTHIIDLEEEMIRGLTQVPWERVDVSFRRSRQRYIAHNTILVKTYWLNSDGADVVLHMIDNFII